MNAERCLLAGEALGLGYAALRKSTDYARERMVFGRPIGMNQGIQHPLASAYMQLEAAKHMTYHAARLYDRSNATLPGTETPNPQYDSSISQHAVGVAANSAKYVAAEAAFTACERSVMSMGGMGYAAEYHVERFMRECFVPRIAPVSRVSCDGVCMLRWIGADSTVITGDDHELCWREGPQAASELLRVCTISSHRQQALNDISTTSTFRSPHSIFTPIPPIRLQSDLPERTPTLNSPPERQATGLCRDRSCTVDECLVCQFNASRLGSDERGDM